MSNDHIKSEISAYLAGGLAESRNRQIEAHAAACEKCRNALNKAKAKQARVKREALKKASPDPLPNLFLARQGKIFSAGHASKKAPRFIAGVLLLAGTGYLVMRHSSIPSRILTTPAQESDSVPVPTSSAPVSAANPTVAPSVAPVAAPAVEAPKTPKPPVILPVQQEWKGAESGIKEARLVVIRDKDGWNQLWTEMQQKEPLPEINFDEHVVLGVFAGERPGVSAISFGRIREREEEVYAPYRIVPLDVQVSSTTASVPTHPFLLALIPHVDKKIRLTEREAQQ